MTDVTKIGIIGMGTVGKALRKAFLDFDDINIEMFDKYNLIYKYETNKIFIRKCNVVFICVPTPTNDGIQDLSELNEVMAWLHPRQNMEQVICIKSTVLPGTTDTYRAKYGSHICHMPEFLDESTAVADIIKPRRPPIIGARYDNHNYYVIINCVFKRIWKDMDVPRIYNLYNVEAELIKYMSNVFFAMKCLFAHQCQEIMDSLDIHVSFWQDILDCFADYSRVGKDHWKVVPKEQFCLGGKCLPKDLEAFAMWCNTMNTETLVRSGLTLNLFEYFVELNEAYKENCKK